MRLRLITKNDHKNNKYIDCIIDDNDENYEDNNNNKDVNEEVSNGGSIKGTISSFRSLPSHK